MTHATIPHTQNGTVDALVLDSYVLEYAANSRCDVNVVGQVFDPYEGAFAFPAGFNDTDLLRRMDLALIAIKETGGPQGQALASGTRLGAVAGGARVPWATRPCVWRRRRTCAACGGAPQSLSVALRPCVRRPLRTHP